MALGILGVIYGILIIAGIVLQALLYKINEESKRSNFIFILNAILSLVLLFIAYTSIPSNYMGQKVIVGVLGLIGIVGIILKFSRKDLILPAKIMLTISILGNLIIPIL